jgi:hypothetical protein
MGFITNGIKSGVSKLATRAAFTGADPVSQARGSSYNTPLTGAARPTVAFSQPVVKTNATHAVLGHAGAAAGGTLGNAAL